MAEMPDTRATRLEESMRRAIAAIEALAEHEKKLDDALARLARSFQETRGLRAQTDRGFPRLAASVEDPVQAQRDAELSRRLDARITKLLADIHNLRRKTQ
jgi:ABC-type transporter Mla subunit MlaD